MTILFLNSKCISNTSQIPVISSQDYTINYFLDNGADPNKLVLGMPTYGRGFICNSAADTGFYAPANQPIPAGPFTGEAGILGYNEVE